MLSQIRTAFLSSPGIQDSTRISYLLYSFVLCTNNRLDDYERTFSSTYETPTDMCFPKYKRRSSLLPGYKIRRKNFYLLHSFVLCKQQLSRWHSDTSYTRFFPLSRPFSKNNPVLLYLLHRNCNPGFPTLIDLNNWVSDKFQFLSSWLIPLTYDPFYTQSRPATYALPEKAPRVEPLVNTYTAHLCGSSFYVPYFIPVTPSFSTIDFPTYCSFHM